MSDKKTNVTPKAISKQEFLKRHAILPELIGGQRHRPPLRAAAFHKAAIVVNSDTKKQIPVRIEFENFPAVEIDVDIVYFIHENKYRLA